MKRFITLGPICAEAVIYDTFQFVINHYCIDIDIVYFIGSVQYTDIYFYVYVNHYCEISLTLSAQAPTLDVKN